MATIAPTRVEIPERFKSLVATITADLDGHTVEPALQATLDRDFPVDGEWFVEMEALCRKGRAEGWLCGREQAGIHLGRPIKAGPDSHGFSVDVVEMTDIVGPHHAHPKGEVDMVMPIDETARFDGTARGWKVYAAGSAHSPTVSDGKALVLYLLPDGAIQFSDPEVRRG
jgi:hypothetical protein